VTLIANYLNRTITVNGFTSSGTDGGGQPTGSFTSKGTIRGRIDPKVQPDEVNGPDLNPVISEYRAITLIPSSFTLTERDQLVDGTDVYEIIGIGQLDGRSVAHHLELDLRKVTA